jgi:hypothetical protein
MKGQFTFAAVRNHSEGAFRLRLVHFWEGRDIRLACLGPVGFQRMKKPKLCQLAAGPNHKKPIHIFPRHRLTNCNICTYARAAWFPEPPEAIHSRKVATHTAGDVDAVLSSIPVPRATEAHILWSAGVCLYPLATPMSSVGEWGIPHTDHLGRLRVAVSTHVGCSRQSDTRHHELSALGKRARDPRRAFRASEHTSNPKERFKNYQASLACAMVLVVGLFLC